MINVSLYTSLLEFITYEIMHSMTIFMDSIEVTYILFIQGGGVCQVHMCGKGNKGKYIIGQSDVNVIYVSGESNAIFHTTFSCVHNACTSLTPMCQTEM